MTFDPIEQEVFEESSIEASPIGCAAKIVDITNLGLMTIRFSQEFLFFKKDNFNSTIVDMYVAPHILNNSTNLNFTWKIEKFSTDNRNIFF